MEAVLGDQSDFADWVARNITSTNGRVKAIRFEQNGIVALGTSGTVTPTWTNGNMFRATITGNFTLAIGTAPPCGTYIVELLENGTGGYTITLPTHNGTTIRWAGGSPPTPTITANALNIVTIISDGTNVRLNMSVNY